MLRKKKRGILKPYANTLLIDLNNLMTTRNIINTHATLVRMGINQNSATKLLRGEAVLVTLRQLTSICYNLNCTPNDIFVVRNMDLPEHHALNKLRKHAPNTALPTIAEWLVDKSVEEVETLLRK